MVANLPPSAEAIVFGRTDWRRLLAQEYEPTAARLLAAYNRTLPRLRDTVDDFTSFLAKLSAEGAPKLTVQELQDLARWQTLLTRVETEMQDFAALLRNEAGLLSDDALQLGIEAAEGMTLATAGDAAGIVSQAWNRPAPEAIARLIGYVDGDPMQARFRAFGANAAQNLADTVITMVAQGKNPRFIAGAVNGWLNVPFAWAETMARTVQLYSYRRASHATYITNSHIVEAWMWWSARDVRTCPSCWSQHGSVHPLDESLDDHHRGRCTELPIIKGANWPSEVTIGPDLFATLPQGDQVQIMGGAMWRAWRAGEVGWGDLSKPYTDEVYGGMLRAPSLVELLGSRASQFYRRG